jgi:hypothetical protein
MTHIEDVQPYWQDLAALDLLMQHGSRRFWFDDVWEKDWRRLLTEHPRPGRVQPPPWLLLKSLDSAHSLLEFAASVRQRLFRSKLSA